LDLAHGHDASSELALSSHGRTCDLGPGTRTQNVGTSPSQLDTLKLDERLTATNGVSRRSQSSDYARNDDRSDFCVRVLVRADLSEEVHAFPARPGLRFGHGDPQISDHPGINPQDVGRRSDLARGRSRRLRTNLFLVFRRIPTTPEQRHHH
jgi:hypothetical protein